MVNVRKLSFEEIEKKEIARLEEKERLRQAKEIAKEKVELGLKYGESDLQNISIKRMQELRQKEKTAKRVKNIKKGVASFGKGVITTLFKKTPTLKEKQPRQPSFLQGKKINFSNKTKEKKEIRFI